MRRNLVLIGFMGTGKTTIGRILAARLGYPFVDSDRKLESQEGKSISEIFEQAGEAVFRGKEKEMIARLSRYTGTVIATGGGVVLDEENVKRLRRNGILVLLQASPEVILERTGRRQNRPLLAVEEREERVRSLLSQREEVYTQAADVVIDTSECGPQEIAEKIVEFVRQGGWLRGHRRSGYR